MPARKRKGKVTPRHLRYTEGDTVLVKFIDSWLHAVVLDTNPHEVFVRIDILDEEYNTEFHNVLPVPSDKEIHDAMHRTADTIAGDMFGLSKDDVGEFEMDRGTVLDYVSTHGSEEVSAYLFHLSSEDRHATLDRCNVPKNWTE